MNIEQPNSMEGLGWYGTSYMQLQLNKASLTSVRGPHMNTMPVTASRRWYRQGALVEQVHPP